jgi:hypothetical protein
MTAPDRGATYQIALASTGSSTHDTWYPLRGSAEGGLRAFTGTCPSGKDAPIAAIRGTEVELMGPADNGHSPGPHRSG